VVCPLTLNRQLHRMRPSNPGQRLAAFQRVGVN